MLIHHRQDRGGFWLHTRKRPRNLPRTVMNRETIGHGDQAARSAILAPACRARRGGTTWSRWRRDGQVRTPAQPAVRAVAMLQPPQGTQPSCQSPDCSPARSACIPGGAWTVCPGRSAAWFCTRVVGGTRTFLRRGLHPAVQWQIPRARQPARLSFRFLHRRGLSAMQGFSGGDAGWGPGMRLRSEEGDA